MEKYIILIFAVLILFCTCTTEPQNEVPPEVPESSSEAEEVSEPEEEPKAEIDYDYYKSPNENKRENEYELPSSYDDDLCFTFEVPDLAGKDLKDLSEFPYLDENPEWCINGTYWIQTEEERFIQYLCEDEEAEELAKAIALFTCHHGVFSASYGSKTFDSITEANEKELLWAAICQTPQKKSLENKNHAFNIVSDYIYELSEHAFVACETYSVSDVEKTFRYLFGEKANFVPQNIEMFGIRYFEELGVFVQFFDGIMMSQSFPQIISYSENNGIYTVKVVLAGTYPNGEIGFDLKLTDGTYEFFPVNKENVALVSEITKPYVYIFEKAEDGHFVMTGFSY